MNLFQKYGIKEIADVIFYSITSIGDEVFYTPVLYLDTLKVSTIEKSSEKVTAKGGKGNKKILSWSLGKDITLKLEDALFTPASMGLLWGGKLQSQLSNYSSIIVKANIANKYGVFNYSIKAYPSPIFSQDEWNIIFKAATEQQIECPEKVGDNTVWYWPDLVMLGKDQTYIKENQVKLMKAYTARTWPSGQNSIPENENGLYNAMPQTIIEKVLSYITQFNKLGTIETNNYNVEVVDRFERCVVRDKKGLKISTQEQKENIFKYYMDERSSNLMILYDEKTMLPLLHINNGDIQGWNDTEDLQFILKFGTPYYKWTRTIKYNDSDDDILGKVIVIDTDTFPGDYKIVGETWIREQKTGKDQRYQFTINRAQISTNTNLTLQATGDPTTFSMNIEVLSPLNGDMFELKKFDVDDDLVYGGTKIIPQRAQYTLTNTTVDEDNSNPTVIQNDIII